MRGDQPLLFCDEEDCDVWNLDAYAGLVSHVNGTRITLTERAPGWYSTDDEDYCPEHATARKDASDA